MEFPQKIKKKRWQFDFFQVRQSSRLRLCETINEALIKCLNHHVRLNVNYSKRNGDITFKEKKEGSSADLSAHIQDMGGGFD